MAIPVGRKVTRVKKVVATNRRLVKGRSKIVVAYKPTSNKYSKTKPKLKDLIKQGRWNAIKVKGSFVWDINFRTLTKAERKKLQELSLAERKARRKKITAALIKKLNSPNPANLKNIGKRVGDQINYND